MLAAQAADLATAKPLEQTVTQADNLTTCQPPKQWTLTRTGFQYSRTHDQPGLPLDKPNLPVADLQSNRPQPSEQSAHNEPATQADSLITCQPPK